MATPRETLNQARAYLDIAQDWKRVEEQMRNAGEKGLVTDPVKAEAGAEVALELAKVAWARCRETLLSLT